MKTTKRVLSVFLACAIVLGSASLHWHTVRAEDEGGTGATTTSETGSGEEGGTGSESGTGEESGSGSEGGSGSEAGSGEEGDTGESGAESPSPIASLVSVDQGGTREEGQPLKLTMAEGAAVKEVTDTVTYTELTKDGVYILKSALVSFDKDGELKVVVENDEVEVTANGEAWTVTFQVSGGLSPYTKYGVVQKLTKAEGTVDDKIPDEGLIHNEDGSVAEQTILVTDYYGNEPYTLKALPEDTKASILTLVSAGGQTATTEKPVTLTAATAAKVTEVIDQIAYVGLKPNTTYTVTATLRETLLRNNRIALKVGSVATQTEKLVTNGVGAGDEWQIVLKDVKLRAGVTYVVFEEVFDEDGNLVASHKSLKDAAQKIVVSGDSSSTSPNTSDRIGFSAILAIGLIVAGLLMLGRKRKTDN